MDKRRRGPRFCIHEAAEVKVAPLRLQRSSRLSMPDLIADINIYVFFTFQSFYCGCTIFPDGLIWPLSVIQNPEEDIKIKEEKKTDKQEK